MKQILTTFALATVISCHSNQANNILATNQSKAKLSTVDTLKKVKYSTIVNFKMYEVDTFPLKNVVINTSNNQTARRFHSAIKWSIDKFGMNFAGHYNLARWGCGTSCINGAITDLKTGKVSNIPPASIDYKFIENSRLLIINPPDSLGYYIDCSYCLPELWTWNEIKKQFEKLK